MLIDEGNGKKCIFAPLKKLITNQKKKEVLFMIIVPVKEGDSIDKALKRLKKKFDKIGVKKEIRTRQEFTKKSVIRREQLRKAIYVQQLRAAENE
jgi:small subunit ribosomal protein S21